MKPSPKKISIFLVLLIALVLIVSIWLPKKYIKENTNQLVQLEVIENHYYDSYYDELAEKLIMCESSGNCLAIVPNDGGSASMGCLQWKPETFKEYALKYGVIGEKASLNYIMTIIWDKKINKYLAVQILKNEPEKAKKLWFNCWRKIHKKYGQPNLPNN
jgi:hypothetical protein